MTSTSLTSPHDPVLSGLGVATHHIRLDLGALAAADSPARAFVVGNAGSGKSSVLRHLCTMLAEGEAPTVLLEDAADIHRVPRSAVLVVDDAHLLDAAALGAIRQRSDDAGAGLIAASRPWPQFEALAAISRNLERWHPPIVLGHVSRSDVLSYIAASGQQFSDACVTAILSLTAGVAWLVADALAAHDERDCADDADHTALCLALQERIVHRLDTVEPAVRHAIEALSLSLRGAADAAESPISDDAIAQGHAEGLLLRSGRPSPVVQWAVRNTISVPRLVALGPDLVDGVALSGTAPLDGGWLAGLGDARVRDVLITEADRALETEPRRASILYASAVTAGGDPLPLAARRAQADLALGDFAQASSFFDMALADVGRADAAERDRLADIAAAIWSARGMLSAASDTYAALEPADTMSSVRAQLCHVGAGRADRISRTVSATGANRDDDVAGQALHASRTAPSTLAVAMRLLGRGLHSSLGSGPSPSALTDLVRASELCTSSRTTAAIVEPPAVIAAVVAILQGEPATAQAAIDAALRGGQGGAGARVRLLLWQAWVAIQRERAAEARESLHSALAVPATRSPRDELLVHALHVCLARRYGDLPALRAAWDSARESILHFEFDLYTILQLTELVSAAARVGDTLSVEQHFTDALDRMRALGDPPLWATPLRWAGIQQGILLNRPESLTPHARALVTAATSNPVAATMAQAGRVWTSVLAGNVDADHVESAARGLAHAGLAWDGARLAGHGAGRTADRKVAARLLSCARELHPNDVLHRDVANTSEPGPADAASDSDVVLSERERDVARLVVQGKTYAEIGETIFISPRTAEHHIAHIRRRLEATSRSDLIAKLRVVLDPSALVPPHVPGVST